MNIYSTLQNFLQRSIPSQADFENLVTLLNNKIIGQVFSVETNFSFSENDTNYILIGDEFTNISDYPILFKKTFSKNNGCLNGNNFYQFSLNSKLSGNFIYGGQKSVTCYAENLSTGNVFGVSFESPFSFNFSLNALSGVAGFQSKNKNFNVAAYVQSLSENTAYNYNTFYNFTLSNQNTFKFTTNFTDSTSFNTTINLISSYSDFYNYEPVLVFDFKNVTNFKTISSSLMAVCKYSKDSSFISANSFQLSAVSGFDVPATNTANFTGVYVPDSYAWYPVYSKIIDTKVIVFIDYFYPLTDETYIKFSFLNYKPQFLSSSLTATSAFTLNNFVSPYTSMNNYISSFFNQPSGSNVLGFSGVNIWTNSFLNDFVKSMEDTDPYLGKAGFLFFTE